MQNALTIRKSELADTDAIESLYPDAFPEEDLLPLVRELLRDEAIATSLVGVVGARIVAHAVFTACGVEGVVAKVALLGPLCVAPAWQRRGVGSAMLREGLRRMAEADVDVVCVLGDPAYYGRLGFVAESLIEPPFPLPPEYGGAWQSQRVSKRTARRGGRLAVPAQWRRRALWVP